MGITASIKALLALVGKRQNDLMEPLKMGSVQSLSNKATNGRWSADDLAIIAEVCGCKLTFTMPNGQQIVIAREEGAKKGPDT